MSTGKIWYGSAATRRRRLILGSSSYIPPLFGLTMAGEVIRNLLAAPAKP